MGRSSSIGAIAGGLLAAPFTGGMSLAATAAAIGGGALAGAMMGDQIDTAKDAAKAQSAAQNAALQAQQDALNQQRTQVQLTTEQMLEANRQQNAEFIARANSQNAATQLYQNQLSSLISQQAAAANRQPEIQAQPGIGAGGRRSGIASAQTGGGGGAGGTMLTGPMGVDPSQLALGRNTLLGG